MTARRQDATPAAAGARDAVASAATDPHAALREADTEARRLAVDEFERPLALQAGAGTGKTRSLVARLATWLLGPGWELAARELDEPAERTRRPGNRSATPEEIAARAAEGVVAITFTEAAAAEMASRLGTALAELAAGGAARDLTPVPSRLVGAPLEARARAIATALPRARLQTIHGFCNALLAEFPFEARLHPEFEIDADGERLARAAREALLARLRGGDAALRELVAEGTDPTEIHAALVELVTSGAEAEELARPRFDDATRDALAERFRSRATPFARRLAPIAAEVAGRSKSTGATLAALERWIAIAADTGLADARLDALAAALRDDEEERKKIAGWGRDSLGKRERDALGADGGAFVAEAAALAGAADALAALDPAGFERARAAFGPLVADTRRRLRRSGVLSYDDLLVEAARLLDENAWVRRRMRGSVRQLLVDEFQDTDRRQCRLLTALAFGDDPESRPGLFVVGDPKQSIYAWRSADLAAYERFLADLRAAGGIEARLARNFRSAPPILAEVETSLAPVLVEEPGVQPPFEPLIAGETTAALSGFRADGRAPVEFWLSWDAAALAIGKAPASARAAAIEAEAVASEISDLVARGSARFGDFAILLRSRGELELFLDAMRRAGVPYAVQKDRSYYRRREVIDAVSLLGLVLDPGDRLALVAALRSPFVGVPDAAWAPLFRHGLPEALERITAADPAALAELDAIVERAAAETPAAGSGVPGIAGLAAWPRALRDALAAVAELRASFHAEPVATFVERLRARFLLEPVAASRFLGRFGVANLGRLFGEIERRLDEAADPLAALAELRAAIDEETPGEEARPPDGGGDAVEVMTIHTAKGLEFDQVFVPQLHRGTKGRRDDRPAALIGAERSPTGVAELRLLSFPSPGWADAEGDVARALEAETARLLYVAMTRAKSRLVLLGAWPRDARARPRGTFVDLLVERRPGAFDDLFDPAATAPLVDRGALWRRPAGAAGGARQGSTSPVAPAPPAAIVSAEDREAARRRAARPRFATASAGAEPDPDADAARALRARLAPRPAERTRQAARARGLALHRAMELAPLAATAPETWERRVTAAYRAEFGDAPRSELATLAADLGRLRDSSLFRRLNELAPYVVARELPLVVPARRSSADAGASPDAPDATDPDDPAVPLLGHLGTLDLLVREPGEGAFVVVDFKSDPAPAAADEIEAWIRDRAERYAPQLRLYGRAVAGALDCALSPRLELWLLAVDRAVVVDPAAPGRQASSPVGPPR